MKSVGLDGVELDPAPLRRTGLRPGANAFRHGIGFGGAAYRLSPHTDDLQNERWVFLHAEQMAGRAKEQRYRGQPRRRWTLLVLEQRPLRAEPDEPIPVGSCSRALLGGRRRRVTVLRPARTAASMAGLKEMGCTRQGWAGSNGCSLNAVSLY